MKYEELRLQRLNQSILKVFENSTIAEDGTITIINKSSAFKILQSVYEIAETGHPDIKPVGLDEGGPIDIIKYEVKVEVYFIMGADDNDDDDDLYTKLQLKIEDVD